MSIIITKEQEGQLARLTQSLDRLAKKMDSLDFSRTERLIDHQHNYIMQSINDFEMRVVGIIENSSGTKNKEHLEKAIKEARNEIIKEMRDSTVFKEQSDPKTEVMLALMQETVRLLREQNQILRK